MDVEYRNDYKPPAPIPKEELHCNDTTPEDKYDFYFVHEVDLLKSDRVELRPFVPSLHAKALVEQRNKFRDIDVHRFQDFSYDDIDETIEHIEILRRNANTLTYAVYTVPPDVDADPSKIKPEDYVIAGTAAFTNANVDAMTTFMDITILPPFQRTHVHAHAIGLLCHRALDMPKDGGYGLRKLGYATENSPENPAIQAAERMEFVKEGVTHDAALAQLGRKGQRPGRPGVVNADRDSVDHWQGCILWEDWEDHSRKKVDDLMARSG